MTQYALVSRTVKSETVRATVTYFATAQFVTQFVKTNQAVQTNSLKIIFLICVHCDVVVKCCSPVQRIGLKRPHNPVFDKLKTKQFCKLFLLRTGNTQRRNLTLQFRGAQEKYTRVQYLLKLVKWLRLERVRKLIWYTAVSILFSASTHEPKDMGLVLMERIQREVVVPSITNMFRLASHKEPTMQNVR